MVALSKMCEGGGMFLFTYRTGLLEYFVGKKKIEKHVEDFFGLYDS